MMADNNGYEAFEDYLNHLQEAESALSRAMDDLYQPGRIKRGLGYRLRVGRAQSAVMTLLVHEINRKESHISGGIHEWEQIEDNLWECIYCEKRTTPRRVGKQLIFPPGTLRYIPFYGRKHRCHG